jgi:hypothetical protein
MSSARRARKKLLLVIGVLVVALVASVGLAMMMKAPKEQDLARARCEMDQSVAMVWKEQESLKAANPGIDAAELRQKVEAKAARIQGEGAGGLRGEVVPLKTFASSKGAVVSSWS